MLKKLLYPVALITTVLLVAGCSSGGDNAGGDTESQTGEVESLVVATYLGSSLEAMQQAWQIPYQEETGIEVLNDTPPLYSNLVEQSNAGNVTWDLFKGALNFNAIDNPLLQDIDCSIVDCAAFEDSPSSVFPQALPVVNVADVVTYNTDNLPNGKVPTGYSDFFDPTIEGSRTLPHFTWGGWKGLLDAALIYDGVQREDLYPMDVDRALAVLDGIGQELIIPQDDAACTQNVATGESIMGLCFVTNVGLSIEEGEPLGFSWSQMVLHTEYLSIPADAPNPEAANNYIAYMVDNIDEILNYRAYGVPKPGVVVDDSPFASYIPTQHMMTGDDAPLVPNEEWWVDNGPDVIETITGWLASR